MFIKLFTTAVLVGVAATRYVDFTPSSLSLTSNAGCYWSGTSPFCAGECGPGEETCGEDNCGDGACCFNGIKRYCCPGGCPASPAPHRAPEREVVVKHSVPPAIKPICNWRGTAPFCNGECFGTEYKCGDNECGDGACCATGSKAYCCTEGCPNDLDLALIFSKAKTEPSAKGGDEVDLCDNDEFICCAPDAGVNKDCKCIKRDKTKRVLHPNQTPFLNGENDDLCNDDETLCCNPDAFSNKECSCIDESSWTRPRKSDL